MGEGYQDMLKLTIISTPRVPFLSMSQPGGVAERRLE